MAKAIDQTYVTGAYDDKKVKMDEISMRSIILHISDNVLHKVDCVKTTTKMWSKLEALYLTKSLHDCIFFT